MSEFVFVCSTFPDQAAALKVAVPIKNRSALADQVIAAPTFIASRRVRAKVPP